MRRPRFIAEQARNASGPLGRLIAFIMEGETWRQNERAIAALNLDAGDHVIDIGCGHGRSLAALAAKTPKGRVVGLDPSELMAEIATRKNRALIQSARVEIAVASAEGLPFQDGAFDKALCVHVVYFWDDLRSAFGEIGRILKPGGQLALTFRSTMHQAAVRSFPPEVYRFRDLAEVLAALRAEGFSVQAEPEDEPVQAKSAHLVLARKD